MALTYSSVAYPQVTGNRRRVTGTVTFDTSYPTGGEAFSITSVGLSLLEDLRVESSDTGYVLVWDRSTSAPKILAFISNDDGGADGPLIQAANEANLSTVIARFEAVGY